MADEIENVIEPLNLRLLIVIGFTILFILIILFYRRKKRVADKKLEKQIGVNKSVTEEINHAEYQNL